MSRYVLYPGYMPSRMDMQRHYIGVAHLRRLYRVPASAHVLVRPDYQRLHEQEVFDATYRALPDDIHCRPLYMGNYPIFEEDGK